MSDDEEDHVPLIYNNRTGCFILRDCILPHPHPHPNPSPYPPHPHPHPYAPTPVPTPVPTPAPTHNSIIIHDNRTNTNQVILGHIKTNVQSGNVALHCVNNKLEIPYQSSNIGYWFEVLLYNKNNIGNYVCDNTNIPYQGPDDILIRIRINFIEINKGTLEFQANPIIIGNEKYNIKYTNSSYTNKVRLNKLDVKNSLSTAIEKYNEILNGQIDIYLTGP